MSISEFQCRQNEKYNGMTTIIRIISCLCLYVITGHISPFEFFGLNTEKSEMRS